MSLSSRRTVILKNYTRAEVAFHLEAVLPFVCSVCLTQAQVSNCKSNHCCEATQPALAPLPTEGCQTIFNNNYRLSMKGLFL